MKILLLIPVILYIALVIFNLDLLKNSDTINIFNLVDITIPALLYSTIFAIGYLIFVIILFDLRGMFLHRKISKLEHEVFALKSELFDEREDIFKKFVWEYNIKIDNFTKEQKELFERFKLESERDLEKQKAETNKILDKLNLLDKSFFDKLKESLKN